jgi:plastocyanin
VQGTAVGRCALLLGIGGLAGCFSDRPATGPDGPGTGTPSVVIENFAFAPPDLTVATGTTVIWTNHDDVSHTVTADDDNAFDSSAFGQGMSFSITAGAPGTYTYFCRIHPFMRATLTVTP